MRTVEEDKRRTEEGRSKVESMDCGRLKQVGERLTSAPEMYTPAVRVFGLLSQAGLEKRKRRWEDMLLMG